MARWREHLFSLRIQLSTQECSAYAERVQLCGQVEELSTAVTHFQHERENILAHLSERDQQCAAWQQENQVCYAHCTSTHSFKALRQQVDEEHTRKHQSAEGFEATLRWIQGFSSR